MLNRNEVTKIVADEFREVMDSLGFESFSEMKHCYSWTTKDITEEVDFILDDQNTGWFIDEIDGDVSDGNEFIPFKTFLKDVRKLLNEKETSNDRT